MPELTKKQQQILLLIYEELNSREIAARLNISVRTVETHRKNIYRKTGISNMVGLIKYGLTHGIIQ
jgi:two-component system nitrate/nitrite response regulator NarL